MLKFLEKFFKKEVPAKKVKKEELADFFSEKAKLIEKGAAEKIEYYKKRLNSIIEETAANINNLKSAKLKNPKISTRELQFMEGNRKSYIQKTGLFLGQLKDLLQYDLNFILSHYQEYIDNFAKATSRPYAILQEFFANESRAIASGIKEIDKAIKQLSSESSVQGHARLESIRKELDSIRNKKEKKRELEKEISHMENSISQINKKKQQLQKVRDDFISSPKYSELKRLENQKAEAELQLKQHRDKLYNDFSLLKKSLRKYQRMAFENDRLIGHYHTDALNALITDSGLKIAGILQGMKKALQEEKIKDKNREKLLHQIEKMHRDYFSGYLERYDSLKKQSSRLDEKLDKEKQHLEDISENLSEAEEKESRLKQRKKQLEEEADIDISSLINRVKEDIEKITGLKIELV
ncbi:hypothetical protein GF323_01355 [Candidatus Woesearchaeota archaeon]|nr:hypothetical protein [Candidatus Woesearchaeota archaeon]